MRFLPANVNDLSGWCSIERTLSAHWLCAQWLFENGFTGWSRSGHSGYRDNFATIGIWGSKSLNFSLPFQLNHYWLYPEKQTQMNIYVAEIVGTALLILLGNGVVANITLKNTRGHASGWIVLTTGWCLALMFAVYAVGRISGAHLNPAASIAMASIGEFPWSQVPGYIIAQTLGAFIGAVLVFVTYLPHWKETKDPEDKLGCFCTAPAINHPIANFVSEAIATGVLVFGLLIIGNVAIESTDVAASVTDATLHDGLVHAFSNWFGPMLVGLLVFSIGLSLGGPTGYAINPARDFGPRLAHAILPIPGKGGSNFGYAWLPIVAPIVGGVIGAQLFRVLGF